MDNIKFSNNVSVKLASAVSATDTTITTQTLPTGITWPGITEPETVSARFWGAVMRPNGIGYTLTLTDANSTPPVEFAAISWGVTQADAIAALYTDGMVEGDLGLAIAANSSLSIRKFTNGIWAGVMNSLFTPIAGAPGIYYANKQCLSAKQAGYVYLEAGYANAFNITVTTSNPPTVADFYPERVLTGFVSSTELGELEYFYVTLMQLESGTWEICKCTAYVQNSDGTWTLTVERAQENSVATDFTSTAIVENRVTAGTLDSMVQAINDQIIITDMISQEELQNIRDAADAIEEIGVTNIQDLIDNANEANETAQNTVASLQSVVDSANAAKNAADAAAVTASTMAAQAEDCRDQSCECATESEAAADDAEAAVTAANAAKTAAQAAQAAAESALEGFKSSGVGLTVFQIDSTTETFVKDPLGVDPVSIADDVNGLILDIADGDYALTLSNETVEVPDPNNPGDTVTKNTVALYKGTAEDPTTYSGYFSGIINAGLSTHLVSSYTFDAYVSLPIQYAAWSAAELPIEGVEEGALALVPSSFGQGYYGYRKFTAGSWVGNNASYSDTYTSYRCFYIQTDMFGTGQGGYIVTGNNAWVPVIVDTPANAPIDIGTTAVEFTGHSVTGLPEWIYVKNLPIDNLTIFSITKPFDNQGNGFYWFRNTWNRLDYTGVGTVQSVDGIQAGTGHDVQLKYSVTKSEFESLQEAGTLIPGARYLVAEEAQSSSSVDNGVPLFSIIDSVSSIAPVGYLDVNVDNGILTQAAFPDAYQQLVNLQNAGDTQILSLEDYAAAVTAEGCCRKFGLDTGTQTFRVPFIPLSYWYGQTMVGKRIATSPTLAAPVGQSDIIIYDDVVDSDCFLSFCCRFADSAGAKSILALVVDGEVVTGDLDLTTYGNSDDARACLYARKGQHIQALGTALSAEDGSINETGVASIDYVLGVSIHETLAPLASHFIKVYGAVSDAGTLNLTQLVTTKANKADIRPNYNLTTMIDSVIVGAGSYIVPSDGYITSYHNQQVQVILTTSVGGILVHMSGSDVASSVSVITIPVSSGDIVTTAAIQGTITNPQYVVINFIPN